MSGLMTILNFDHTLTSQDNLLGRADKVIEMADIRETNLMCSPEAQLEIRARLKLYKPGNIVFIGNGNLHYVSFLLMERLEEPFSLVLFDHHTDCKNTELQLACDNWVIHAASLPKLKKALVFHTDAESLDIGHHPASDKIIEFIPGERWSAKFENKVRQIDSKNVYLSIDKDILSSEAAATNWDQGGKSLDELLRMIEIVKKHKNIIGADICGEYPVNPAMMFDSSIIKRIKLNERANLTILEVLTQ